MTITSMAKGAGDVSSVGIIVATFLESLPHIAAILSIFWVLLRIWADPTFQILWEKAKKKFGKD